MIGERISGRYQIIETIGGGGMANVYKAHDIILDRLVAVKVLQPHFSDDEQFIRRFRREAQAATSLAHPNVVTIYDVGEDGNTYFIVMEYVEGQTLKELIQAQGPLPVAEALDYMEQMLSAIAHAHANHLIHRDIKPHNILIRRDGLLKVTDFGIARAISSATITHTNSIIGSVHYLSPEQARGGLVTYKSDIYSLGIVLYEMVTGDLPFSGDTAVSIAIKHLQNDIPSAKERIPSLPQSVENIIRKATCKDPLKRYDSVDEMAADVATALDPNRFAEPPFIVNDDEDGATKAIPIIRDVPNYDDVEQTIEVPREKKVETPSSSNGGNKKNNQTKKAKKGKKRNWLLILAVIFVLFFSALVAAFTLLPSLFKVDEVEVLDVIGKPFDEAEAELTQLGLVVEREEVPSDEIPADHVVRQNPEPHSVIKENATVTLFVSEGKQEVKVENYVGMTIEKAESMLKELHFEVEKVPQQVNNERPGIVIAQDPKKGETVVAEETTITLTYSVESVTRLENLIGVDEKTARAYLEENHLSGIVQSEYSPTVPKGHVIRQVPEPYTNLKAGESVSIILSKGPEPTPDPKPQEPAPPPPTTEPEKEPTRLIDVNQTVSVSEEDQEAGKTFDIRIVYRDAETNGQDKVFVEENIAQTKEYKIPLRVSPSHEGSFEVYVNGEIARRSKTYKY